MNQRMTCPSCGAEQEVSDRCTHCEIYFEKYYQTKEMQRQQAGVAEPSADAPAAARVGGGRYAVDRNENQALVKAIIAAVIAAIVGAFIWKGIAVLFEMELGLVAWGIGALIGFAAAFAGGRGLASGVICALLAAGAIMLGKYMAVESFRSDFTEIISLAGELDDAEMELGFEEIRDDARMLAALPPGDVALREFMVERGYSEAYTAMDVSSEELQYFREFEQPGLMWVEQAQPSYQEWLNYNLGQISEISSWELIRADLGFLDAVFILLGVATAFRLGAGSED